MAVYILYYPGLLRFYTFCVHQRNFHENETIKRENEAEGPAHRLYTNDFWTQRPKIDQVHQVP